MSTPSLALTVQLQPLRCTAKDYYQYDCNRLAEHECVYCGQGLCVLCELPCYECGENLHDDCRSDHAKESGHDVDGLAHQGGLGRLAVRS